MNNYEISIIDTDAITFGKQDRSLFTKEEIVKVNEQLNSMYGEYIRWDFEDNFSKIIAIRTKNYVLLNQEGKLTIKGSALKASTKSPKLKQLIKDIIDNILADKNDYEQIYLDYVRQVALIKTPEDIKAWSVRKTITSKVLNGTRKNETNVLDAIQGSELGDGDRCTMFYRDDGTLSLSENFNGDYSKDKLYQQLFDTIWVFSTVLDMFPIKNFKLKKHKKDLALM